MESWKEDWTRRKCTLASRLASGECDGSYAEAVLILCSTISALAAEVWPGAGKDRVRFIEVMRQFARGDLGATRISVPLLAAALREKDDTKNLQILEDTLLPDSPDLVITGDQVDVDELRMAEVCPSLTTPVIRSFSYAAILYREARSAYVHEFESGRRADAHAMSAAGRASVSYTNWVDDPDRRIHFGVEWLVEVALSIARSIDAASVPSQRPGDPATWWIAG